MFPYPTAVSMAKGSSAAKEALPPPWRPNDEVFQMTMSTSNNHNASSPAVVPDDQRHLQDGSTVFLAGIFDTTSFEWGTDLFRWTIEMINDHSDGWHDEIFADDPFATSPTRIEWQVADAACDESTATRAYFDITRNRTAIVNNNNANTPQQPIWHGLIGARCSGASAALARLVAANHAPGSRVVQISPSATSSELSAPDNFPYFKRTVAPGDDRGEVGALVAFLRAHGWDRVAMVSTDTSFGKGIATKFRRLWQEGGTDTTGAQWTGDVADYQNIELNAQEEVDEAAAIQALESMPGDPRVKSRVVLLFAHDQHAYHILKIAQQIGFQPDTIWVGTASWTDRLPEGSEDWIMPLPSIDKGRPAYFGITPFRNRDQYYQEFLMALRNRQALEGYSPLWTELPDYAAEYMVDAILALTLALSAVRPFARGNADLIAETVQNLEFDGVSGPVSFAPEGHRANPRYSVYNLQEVDGFHVKWQNIGYVGTTVGSYYQGVGACFAGSQCDIFVSDAPSDKYPVPEDPILPGWTVAILVILMVLLLALMIKYWRSRKSKKDKLSQIDNELADIDSQLEKAKKRQELLVLRRAELKNKPDTWSEDTSIMIEVHPTDAQYWDVTDRLQESMDDAHISKLWRIQNDPLWAFYSFHKDRLETTGVSHNERQVWHGTSQLDPAVIYNDKQDGFMMQYSREGFWGRGIYFADKSAYSHHYAYKPSRSNPHRKGAGGGEREMFLTKLLIGNQTFIDRNGREFYCSSLTVPPTDPSTNLKYNTVAGHTGGSDVWIVYENGRAYPDYLVRYYRGSRDRKKTPYSSRAQALSGKPPRSSMTSITTTPDDDVESGGSINSTGAKSGASINSTGATWEFNGDSGWTAYDASQQSELEKGFQTYLKDFTKDSMPLQGPQWKYEVNFLDMEQKNVEHGGARVRSIRRT